MGAIILHGPHLCRTTRSTHIGALLVFFVAMMWMQHVIDDQQSRNDYLKSEIASLDKQIKEIEELDKTRADLITRKDIIEQLQSNRSQMVHLFDELVKTIPDGARLWDPETDETPPENARFGVDDKLFRLDRAPLADCLSIISDDETKAEIAKLK